MVTHQLYGKILFMSLVDQIARIQWKHLIQKLSSGVACTTPHQGAELQHRAVLKVSYMFMGAMGNWI
jgi:hypothetical protein